MEFTIQNATTSHIGHGGYGSTAAHWLKNNKYTALSTLIIIALATFVVRVKRLREFELARSKSLPRLPANKFIGNLPAFISLFKDKVPQDAHPHGHVTMLQRKHDLEHIFFMDTWPFSVYPAMIITDPELATQVVQTVSLPKHPELRNFIAHITGPTSLIITEGAQWKAARSLFNPGFALSHLLTLVPSIVDDTAVFSSILSERASSGEVFQLEDLAARLTIDIMAHVVLDHDLNSMVERNELVECFRALGRWTPGSTNFNPFAPYNPVLITAQWWYSRKMTNILGNILEERFKRKIDSDEPIPKVINRRKPAIDLALDEYAKQLLESNENTKQNHIINAKLKQGTSGIDKVFKKTAIDSMRSFLFAGHDTSSSTICFIYHCLSRNPQAAERLRREHDEVFGKDVEEVGARLKEDPNLSNRLPYTTAVIKESLRVFPPASTVRLGIKGVDVVYKGESYPTEGLMVWVVSHSIHRRADLFPSPDEFIPERFLPTTHEQFWKPQIAIPKDAWRPFEKGIRNCIGQELAMLETKIMLCMTTRKFHVEAAYELWDQKLGRVVGKGEREMFGQRAYQMLQNSAKPSDGFPAVVSRR